jgi:hypothetical protein
MDRFVVVFERAFGVLGKCYFVCAAKTSADQQIVG